MNENTYEALPHFDKDKNPVWIQLDDILFIKQHESILKKNFYAQTLTGIFDNYIDISKYFDFLNKYGFEAYGKILVNQHKVKKFNSLTYTLYFDNNITKDTLNVVVAQRAIKQISKVLGSEFDIADKKNAVEYSPIFNRKNFINT